MRTLVRSLGSSEETAQAVRHLLVRRSLAGAAIPSSTARSLMTPVLGNSAEMAPLVRTSRARPLFPLCRNGD